MADERSITSYKSIMADDTKSITSYKSTGSKGSRGSRGSKASRGSLKSGVTHESTRSLGSKGSYADTGRNGVNFSRVAPFVIAKPFILKKQRVREERAAKERQVSTAEEMLAADREAKIFEREMKLGRKLTTRELKQHEAGGGVHLTNPEIREYLGLDGPVKNVPRKRCLSSDEGGERVADLGAVKKDLADGDGPSGVLSAEASFILKRREIREVVEARQDKEELTMTPQMRAMRDKWAAKAEANKQRRQQGGLATVGEESTEDDRPLVAYDYSGGDGGRRWFKPPKYKNASAGAAPGAAGKAVKTLTPLDFSRAEEAELEYIESPMPLLADPPGWKYRGGDAGVGYYFVRDEVMVDNVTTNRRSRNSRGEPLLEKKQGWGRRCMKAFAANDFKALRAAYTATAPTREDGVINLNGRVKGGASWYYGDFYVRLGLDPEPFPPRPGDTLLHMALRYKRSASFVATILDLGADNEIANNCGEKAYELDAPAFRLAEALVEQWAKERGLSLYGSTQSQGPPAKKKKWYAEACDGYDGYDGYFRARTEVDAREQATAAGVPLDVILTRKKRRDDDGSTLTLGSSYVETTVADDETVMSGSSISSRSVLSLPRIAEGAVALASKFLGSPKKEKKEGE